VPERYDGDEERIIDDRVNDAVVTDSHTQAGSALQSAGGRGARILRQQSNGALEAMTDRRV